MRYKDANQLPEHYRLQVENSVARSNANLERSFINEPLDTKKSEGCNSPVSIHVHSIRKRYADPDGISAKYAIDGMRYSGILQDDTLKQVKEVTFSQEKGDIEQTIITIY